MLRSFRCQRLLADAEAVTHRMPRHCHWKCLPSRLRRRADLVPGSEIRMARWIGDGPVHAARDHSRTDADTYTSDQERGGVHHVQTLAMSNYLRMIATQ